MNKTLIVALVAAFAATPLAAHAAEGRCDSDGAPALGIVQIDLPDGSTYYVDDRNFVLGNGIWLYEESNSIGFLQRGGASDIVPDDPEICVDDPEVIPDRLLV